MPSCFYSQLFGEDDPDQDVSPDTEDPEAAGVWSMVQRTPAVSIYFTSMREFIIKLFFYIQHFKKMYKPQQYQ